MKLKNILPVGCLLLATVIGGCGATSTGNSAETSQKVTDNGISHTDTQTATQTDESINKEASNKENSDIMSAYQEILKAAPAIEGEHMELNDASFDYEQNRKLFGEHYELYAVCDINQDEIPELIALSTVNFRWNQISVYTYADGEAVLLKNPMDIEASYSFNQISTANGAYTTYICGENHIHSVWRGTNPIGEQVEENYAYTLENVALNAVDCTISEGEATISFYDIAKANTAENVSEMMQ